MPPAAGPGWRRAFVVTVTTGRWGSSRFQPNGCWRTGCYPTGRRTRPVADQSARPRGLALSAVQATGRPGPTARRSPARRSRSGGRWRRYRGCARPTARRAQGAPPWWRADSAPACPGAGVGGLAGGREADRPGVHRLADDLAHVADLGFGGFAVGGFLAQHVQPQRRVSERDRHFQLRPGSRHRVQVLGKGLERPGDPGPQRVGRHALDVLRRPGPGRGPRRSPARSRRCLR